MKTIKLIKSSGKCYCRGNSDNCIAKNFSRNNAHKIPKGDTCLSIYIYSSSGFNTSYYCKECMLEIFDEFEKAKFDLINGV